VPEQEPLDSKTLALHIGVLYDALQRHRRRTTIATLGMIATLVLAAVQVVMARGVSARVAAVELWSVETDKYLKETANELVATKTVSARQTQELTDQIASVRREKRDDPLPAIADRMKDTVALIVCQDASGDYTTGSGTIFTSNGLVLTNQHVLPEAAEEAALPCAIVYQPWKGDDGSAVFGLAYVSGDPARDLAVVRMVDQSGAALRPNQIQNLEAIEGVLCEDSEVSVARSLLILGYPNYSDEDVDPTLTSLKVTSGKISSLLSDGDVVTDAKLEHGNSGGAAFLDSGCFIGVPTAVLTGRVETLGVIRRVRAPEE